LLAGKPRQKMLWNEPGRLLRNGIVAVISVNAVVLHAKIRKLKKSLTLGPFSKECVYCDGIRILLVLI
jgi:hypothetical protein